MTAVTAPKLVYLVEEPSMADFINGWAPRAFPQAQHQSVPHEGKKDLRNSIPRKLRAWRDPGLSFVIVMDNDGGDCLALKRELTQLCAKAERPDALVRVVCQELEAWWLGDPEALLALYPSPAKTAKALRAAKYRDPDAVAKPSQDLARLFPNFQKGACAKQMTTRIDRMRSRSASFRAFCSGVERLLAAAAPTV